jgi:hypothetical protein
MAQDWDEKVKWMRERGVTFARWNEKYSELPATLIECELGPEPRRYEEAPTSETDDQVPVLFQGRVPWGSKLVKKKADDGT